MSELIKLNDSISVDQLTLTKIKALDFIDNDVGWVEQLPWGEASIVGKLPTDIVFSICNKRGYFQLSLSCYQFSQDSLSQFGFGAVVYYNDQLHLAVIPYSKYDFYRLSPKWLATRYIIEEHKENNCQSVVGWNHYTTSSDSKEIERHISELIKLNEELEIELDLILENISNAKYLPLG